jgi:hypothetical protein
LSSACQNEKEQNIWLRMKLEPECAGSVVGQSYPRHLIHASKHKKWMSANTGVTAECQCGLPSSNAAPKQIDAPQK